MLRTIMIFPHFSNIEIINEIRDRYDPLSKFVSPHITIVFPFESEMTNDELEEKLTGSLKDVEPFELVLHGFSKTSDNFLFLDIEKGQDVIKTVHDELYLQYFQEYDLGLPYIPHMTVGKFNNNQELDRAYEYVNKTDAYFQTTVRKISLEMIGEHEESIIAFETMLEG